jgi:hypothetical protein
MGVRAGRRWRDTGAYGAVSGGDSKLQHSSSLSMRQAHRFNLSWAVGDLVNSKEPSRWNGT